MNTNGSYKQKDRKRNYLLKILYGQKTERYETHSIRTFLHKTRTINWGNGISHVYLRISYGFKIGKITAYNDGSYSSKTDFDLALYAFLEV